MRFDLLMWNTVITCYNNVSNASPRTVIEQLIVTNGKDQYKEEFIIRKYTNGHIYGQVVKAGSSYI